MIGMMNNIETLKLDVTHIIREKHICDICLGGVKNSPVVLVGEKDCINAPIEMTEKVIGVVISEGILYSSLDGRFYVEIQTFYKSKYDCIDSCEFIIIDDVLKISSFIIYE